MIAVVTGASSGIGAAIAAALADAGHQVTGIARRGPVPCDVTDERQVDAVFAAAGAVDLLVLAAGAGRFAPLARTTPADLRALFEVHAIGTLNCVRAALRTMLPRRAGRIIGIGSTAEQRAFPGNAAYAASKAAQSTLLRVVAEEHRASGLRVTRLTVGAVDTPIWDNRPEFTRARAGMLAPAAVAAAVLDLASATDPPEQLELLPPIGHL